MMGESIDQSDPTKNPLNVNRCMSGIDHLRLDGSLLRLFVAVMETGSISSAADRLSVSQSAVSHQIEKLRAIVGDPLFVKSGRGIVATARAEGLVEQARVLLDQLESFAKVTDFHPGALRRTFTIAANDLQRDLLLPSLLERLRAQSQGVCMRVVASDVPSLKMLREQRCDLVISPRPPEGGDILQQRLFDDTYHIFFDGGRRRAPDSIEDYLRAEHVTVLYEGQRGLEVDKALLAGGHDRKVVAFVPGFSGVASFIQGTDRLATLPSLLQRGQLRGLDSVPLPICIPPMPMYMIWHMRHRDDPVHRWLRATLLNVARSSQLGR